jgi:LysM repeat protein
MPLRTFSINLDDTVYQAAQQRAQSEGKTLSQILADLGVSYARGTAPGGFLTYAVQRGDTLARIAGKFYNDPHQYPLIQQVNQLANPAQIWVGQVLLLPLSLSLNPTAPGVTPVPAPTLPPLPLPTPAPPSALLPDPTAPIPGELYGVLPIVGAPSDRPAAQHGDLNLALRGFNPAAASLGLIDMAGPTDTRAPQLVGVFADKRAPVISSVYRVNQWDWGRNARGGAITDFEVTLIGLQIKPAETVHVPDAGYSIGQGYAVLALYADQERLTLKYTGEDNVVIGYTLHIEGICVAPSLLALYNQMNAAGRRQLPALRAGQALGRAWQNEIRVAIRDSGRFMDPRVRKDWWRGR